MTAMIEFLTARFDEHAERATHTAAEVNAKRLILKFHGPVETGFFGGGPVDPLFCGSCGAYGEGLAVAAPCRTLRALALPYAAHGDYQPAWATIEDYDT